MISGAIDTGSTITIESPFIARSLAAEIGVTINVTYPAGVSYLSHVASNGSFDGSTWTVSLPAYDDTDDESKAATVETLSITVTVDDEAAFSGGTRLVTMTAPAFGAETETGDNSATRLLPGITCTDINGCVTGATLLDYEFTEQNTGIRDAENNLDIFQRSFLVPNSIGNPVDTGVPFNIGQIIKFEHFTRNNTSGLSYMNEYPLDNANTLGNLTYEVTMPLNTPQSILTVWYIKLL